MKTIIWRSFWLVWLSCPLLLAQQDAQDTRSNEIDEARSQKQQNLEAPEDPRLEKAVIRAESSFVYRWFTSTEGPGIGYGQMVPGAGFALGLRYQKPYLEDHLHLATYLDGSVKKYYKALFTASLVNLWDGHGFVYFGTSHSDYPEMPYYGPGPDSLKRGRSDYNLEKTDVEIRPVLRPVRHVQLGLIGAFQAIHVGPGTASRYISTDLQYPPSVTPGIEQQTNYLEGGGFVEYDWRNTGLEEDPLGPLANRTADPSSGGYYHAEYAKLSDREVGIYSFYRTNFDVRQYIPLFNRKRVIALHGATWLTDTNSANVVPFYMQPTLGGPDTLRGFRDFRFYDNNAVLVQGEYRWEASSLLEMALFSDGGKVFHDWNQWNLHSIEGDFGFGLRFKMQSRVALRLDTAFSHEGFAISLRNGNPF